MITHTEVADPLKPPCISIIVPSHNEEKSLPRCLSALGSQTFQDWEAIVVDDASTDGTQEVVTGLASRDPRFRYTCLPKNQGQAAARNVGIELARGAYLFFLDADDWIPREALSTLYAIATESGDEVIVGKTASRVHIDGNYVRNEVRHATLFDHPEIVYCQSVWNKLIDAGLINRTMLRFDAQRKAEDILFALRMFRFAHGFSITTRVTYHYQWERQARRADTKKLIDARCNQLQALEEICALGNSTLTLLMQVKSARALYGSMARCQHAFSRAELYEHLRQWRIVLATFPATVFKRLPTHQQPFFQLLRWNLVRLAHLYWQLVAFYRNRGTNTRSPFPPR